MRLLPRTPLLLLPGLLCDSALWRHQLDSLGDLAAIQVADLTLDDTIAGMARRVLDQAPDRFVVVGLSMGGYVAQEIMRQAPQRVLGLGLMDTNARADRPEQRAQRKLAMEQADLGRFRGVTERLLPALVHPDRVAEPAVADTVMAMAERTGVTAFRRQQGAIMDRPDGRQDLARISCPTLVVCGRQDAITPVKVHQEMVDLLPAARFVVIEDCGHLPPLERPQAVSAVLRYWLSAP